MSEQIKVVYKDGVLVPLKPLDLPEGSIVEIRIIKFLDDADEFVKNIEKDLTELDADELRHLEEELNKK